MAPRSSHTKAAAAHWDERFENQASPEARDSWYALASPLYQQQYLDGRFGGKDWVDWVLGELKRFGPFRRALFLGCGTGDGLVDFYQRGLASEIHGVDLSETAIAAGREAASRAGLDDQVTFEQGDFHDLQLDRSRFDLVVMVMSLHHALDLEVVTQNIRNVQTSNGVLVVNEYVGPDRWQYSTLQVLAIQSLLTLFPRRLRTRPDGTRKGRIGRPSIEWMLSNDPSEAAHSSEILSTLRSGFRVVTEKHYGGSISIPVLDEIIGNFSKTDRASMFWLRATLATDRILWRLRLVPSSNAIVIALRD